MTHMAGHNRSDEIKGGTDSLSKGLDLFRLIADDGGHTRISQLAIDLGYPRTTLHRLLGELLRHRMILRVGHGRYAPGMVLAEIEPATHFNEQLASIARPLLQTLADNNKCTAHLGVLEDAMVTYLVKVGDETESLDFTQEGGQLEAYCSGIGKVLLASRSEKYLEDYLASGPFIPFTDRTIISPRILAKCLAEVRLQGWAADDREAAQGLQCLAVPVSRKGRPPIAAISLSHDKVLSAGCDMQSLDALKSCAKEIADRL